MAATGSGLVGCLLLMLTRGVFSMSNCNTESAICAFNGRLQGTILFQEKHGFGCSSFGDADGLHVQIDLQGFDPQDRVTAHNFRIKSFAGLMPNCTGMGPDHGQGLRGADLGTYAESKGGVVQISDARLKNGPSLSGAQSIVGRSVAVLKGQDPQARFQTRQVTLGCCIIGVADLQGLAAGNSFGQSNTFSPQASNTNSFHQPGNNFSPPANTFNPPANTFNPQGSNFNQPGNNFSPPANTFSPPRNNFNQPGNTFNTNPTGGFNNGASGGFNNGGRPAAGGRAGGGGGGFNSFNSQPPASSTYGPFAASAIRRQSAATRPSPQELSGSFTNSAFKSPFALGDRFSFFDLSGKTSGVDSVLPDNVKDKFAPPEPPRFQDIYGLDNGDSPLGRSGYGNSVRPDKGSKLSQMFFKDQDIKSTVGFSLSPEEMDIPRESGEEESNTSHHEDRDVDNDPGYDDALDGPNRDYTDDNPDVESPGGAANSFDKPQPAGPLPSEYGSSDLSKASFLPNKGQGYDDNSLNNIDINQNYHNGKPVEDDLDAPPAAGTVPHEESSAGTVPHEESSAGGEGSDGATNAGSSSSLSTSDESALSSAPAGGNSGASDAALAPVVGNGPETPGGATGNLPAVGDLDPTAPSEGQGASQPASA